MATCAPGVFPSTILGSITSSHHRVASHLNVSVNLTNVKTVMIMIEMVGILLMRMTRTERLLKHTNVILVLVFVLAMLMNDGRRVTTKKI